MAAPYRGKALGPLLLLTLASVHSVAGAGWEQIAPVRMSGDVIGLAWGPTSMVAIEMVNYYLPLSMTNPSRKRVVVATQDTAGGKVTYTPLENTAFIPSTDSEQCTVLYAGKLFTIVCVLEVNFKSVILATQSTGGKAWGPPVYFKETNLTASGDGYRLSGAVMVDQSTFVVLGAQGTWMLNASNGNANYSHVTDYQSSIVAGPLLLAHPTGPIAIYPTDASKWQVFSLQSGEWSSIASLTAVSVGGISAAGQSVAFSAVTSTKLNPVTGTYTAHIAVMLLNITSGSIQASVTKPLTNKVGPPSSLPMAFKGSLGAVVVSGYPTFSAAQLWYTTDGGSSWQNATDSRFWRGPPSFTSDKDYIWAYGAGGQLARTSDGATWEGLGEGPTAPLMTQPVVTTEGDICLGSASYNGEQYLDPYFDWGAGLWRLTSSLSWERVPKAMSHPLMLSSVNGKVALAGYNDGALSAQVFSKNFTSLDFHYTNQTTMESKGGIAWDGDGTFVFAFGKVGATFGCPPFALVKGEWKAIVAVQDALVQGSPAYNPITKKWYVVLSSQGEADLYISSDPTFPPASTQTVFFVASLAATRFRGGEIFVSTPTSLFIYLPSEDITSEWPTSGGEVYRHPQGEVCLVSGPEAGLAEGEWRLVNGTDSTLIGTTNFTLPVAQWKAFGPVLPTNPIGDPCHYAKGKYGEVVTSPFSGLIAATQT